MTKSQTIDTTDGSIEQLILSQVETLEQTFGAYSSTGCTGNPSIWRLRACCNVLELLSIHPSIHPIYLCFTLYTLSSHTLRFQHVAQKNSSFAAGMFCLPRCHWIKNFSSGSPRKAPHPHRPVTNFLHKKKARSLGVNDTGCKWCQNVFDEPKSNHQGLHFLWSFTGFLLENCLALSSSPSIHSVPTSDSSGRLGVARATPLQNIS